MDNDLVQTDEYMRYRPSPEQAPWSIKPKDRPPKSLIDGAFTIFDNDSTFYERVVPEIFNSTDKDDLLMRSVIENYAIEGRGDDDKPTGHFYLTKSDLEPLIDEVMNNNMGMSGE